ncbi:hypothetical protein KY327_02980 [Candidatus Woesearchaeota archaeon]|nr:hypothetical protein [Candidatus Woesearchaeota archaeon]
MLTLVFSPQWFYGYDIIFELLGILVTGLIGLYSLKLYRFSKERTYKYFGLSFLAFAVSFAAKIATNFVLYYQHTVKTTLEEVIIRHNLLQKSNLLLQAGYDVHRFLLLLGLLGIYWIVSKSIENEHRWLLLYLLLIVSLFSFSTYYVFHLTAAFLLLFITRHLHRVATRRKAPKTAKLNFLAFALLLLSQLVFVFVWVNKAIYAVAEVVQLAGFVVFLASILNLVFRNGKKKDKD